MRRVNEITTSLIKEFCSKDIAPEIKIVEKVIRRFEFKERNNQYKMTEK